MVSFSSFLLPSEALWCYRQSKHGERTLHSSMKLGGLEERLADASADGGYAEVSHLRCPPGLRGINIQQHL